MYSGITNLWIQNFASSYFRNPKSLILSWDGLSSAHSTARRIFSNTDEDTLAKWDGQEGGFDEKAAHAGHRQANRLAARAFKGFLRAMGQTEQPPLRSRSVYLVTCRWKRHHHGRPPLSLSFEVGRLFKWIGQFDVPQFWLKQFGFALHGLRGETLTSLWTGTNIRIFWVTLLIQGFCYMHICPGISRFNLSGASWLLSL